MRANSVCPNICSLSCVKLENFVAYNWLSVEYSRTYLKLDIWHYPEKRMFDELTKNKQ